MTDPWQQLAVSPDRSHHLLRDHPAYQDRYDEVMSFHRPGLAPVRRGDEAWHIRPDGGDAYAHRFRRTFGFYEGLAAVADDAGWYHIRPNGQPAYERRLGWCGNVQQSRVAVRFRDGTYGHLDRTGSPVGDRWRYVGDYREGAAVVQAADGRHTHVDPNGVLLHGHWFEDLDVFHKGHARARDAHGWMHIDRNGAALYNRRFANVEPYYNSQARVERLDGTLEVVGYDGRTGQTLRGPLTIPDIRLLAGMAAAALAGPLGCWSESVLLAGGWYLPLLRGEPPRDLDLFCRSPEHLDDVGRRLEARGARLILDNPPFQRRYRCGKTVVELAYNVWCRELDEVFARFDLGPSMVGARWHNGVARSEIHPLAADSLRRREVLVNRRCPNHKYALVSVARAHRYAARLGFVLPEAELSSLWGHYDRATPTEQGRMRTRYSKAGVDNPSVLEQALVRSAP